jgi:CheY-like chemotaxis protein
MPTLLLVDDNDVVRDVLRLQAEHRGLEVVGEARDGPEAIELAERLEPDAIILDHEMPTMTGLTALRAIRRRAPEVVVVMYCSDTSIRESAVTAGARAFFTKGDSPRDVVKGLLGLLAESRFTEGSAK